MNADVIDVLKSLVLLKSEGSLSYIIKRETVMALCELLNVHGWCGRHSPLSEFAAH